MNSAGITDLEKGVVCLGPKLKRYRWMFRRNEETGAHWYQFYRWSVYGWVFLNNERHHKIIAQIKEKVDNFPPP